MSGSSDFQGALAVIEQEKERRLTTSKPIRAIETTQSTELDGLFNAGTAVVLLFPEGSEMLAQIESCALGDYSAASALTQRIRSQYTGRRQLPLDEAAEVFRNQPTICCLNGGRFALGESLFLPNDMEVSYASMPYNGGSLNGVPFSLIQYYDPDQPRKELDAVVVFRSPPLSSAEKAALAALPADQLDLNVGPIAECWRVTAFGIALAVIVITIGCEVLPIFASISEETIARIGPERTARALLKARREALQKQSK